MPYVGLESKPVNRRIHGDEDARGAALDFAVNVLGNEPPRFVIDALTAAIPQLAAYPDAQELAAVEALIAEQHGVDPRCVMLTNGAAEGFALVAGLGIKTPAVVHPGFSEPEIIFRERGMDVSQLVLEPPFSRLGALGECDSVVIGNPTNPTGQVFSPHMLRRWAGDRILVVDEAFLDVVVQGEELSAIALVAHGDDRLVVLRSLTKTWSIAGLRVGYMVAHPELICRARLGRSHWPMGTLQLVAARAIMSRSKELLPDIVDEVAAHRSTMRTMLNEAGWTEASDSVAPYLLYRPNVLGLDPELVRRRLLEKGIAIRRCDTFPGLDTSYWRLAVREAPKVAQLLEAVAQTVTELTGEALQ